MYRKSVHIYGYSADTDSGEGDVWGAGGAYTWPTSATTTTIVSANDTDESTGTGARTVFIDGLDSSGYEVSETASMSGTDSVTLTYSYWRINNAYVATAGSCDINVGNITIGSTDFTTISYIPANEGASQNAIYTVPVGYPDSHIVQWGCSHYDSAGYQIVRLQVRPTGGAWKTVEKVIIGSSGTNAWVTVFDRPYHVAEKTDIRIHNDASTNDGIVWGSFDVELGD